ncbi:MAG: RNA polymerase sigma factor [Gemmatimonadaceae bacterium]
MDDVPSRPVEKSRSEHEAAGRDFYDLGTDFTVLHREIAKGVLDAVGKRCTKDDCQLVLQKVAIAGWKKWKASPGCFTPGTLRTWASRRAVWRLADLKEERRKDALAELALQREYEAGNFDAKLADAEIEEEEFSRAFAGKLLKLEPFSLWAVIEVFFRKLTHREAAAELGLSKTKLERKLDEAKAVLARELADWDPRASHEPSATPPTIPPTRRS